MNAVIICLFSVLLSAHARKLDVEDGAQNGFLITLPSDCIGHELCLTKPIDYPSEDIDRVARRLQLRPKRRVDDEVSTKIDERNGCATSRQIIQPFVAVYNHTQHLVVQSEFYKQTIPSVRCEKEGARCLHGFTLSGSKPCCVTKFSTVSLSVLDIKDLSVTNLSITFPVECACEGDKDSK